MFRNHGTPVVNDLTIKGFPDDHLFLVLNFVTIRCSKISATGIKEN